MSHLTEKLQRAFARLQSGDLREAERLCGEVLGVSRSEPRALHLLGVVRLAGGSAAEAVSLISQALEGGARDATMLEHLGLARLVVESFPAAESAFREAISIGPAHGILYMRLGMALAAQGKLEEGVTALREAAARAPRDPDVLINLGNTLAELGHADEALSCYGRVLALDSRHPGAHFNMGTQLMRMGRLEQAESAFRAALAVVPEDPDVHSNLGRVYERQVRPQDAAACFRKAIELDPARPDDHFGLGEMYRLQGRLEEAIASYEQALKYRPGFYQALSELAHQRQAACRWKDIEELWNRLRREALGKTGAGVQPFNILSFSTSPREQLACAIAWTAQEQFAPYQAQRAKNPFDFSSRAPRTKLRIGYFSWDFHQHATSSLIAELFELHDRARFEIFAYDYGPDDGSAMRSRLMKASDHFVVLRDVAISAGAQRIYGDEIDILVDLTGHTLGGRPEVMMLRPAPVQMSWLGYPGTMGMDCIDYIVADSFVIPEGAEGFYSERVIRLPGCYQINDRKREVSARTPTREQCGLPESAFVFCCFNQSYKILPEMFALWMRIMNAVPDSVLWLLESNRSAVENLRREAIARGVAGDRVVFAPRAAAAEHLARYQVADLCIDTFPYTSHTTASDALWAGCPLVTCAGETFASRVAGSVLINAGMRHLVTHSFEEHERLVLELATHPGTLAMARRALREARDSCALFDTPEFVRGLERAYEAVAAAYPRPGIAHA